MFFFRLLAPDYLNLVFCNGIREGNEEEWNFIWNLHDDKKTSAEKTILYPSLGCTPHVDILNKYVMLFLIYKLEL